MKQKISKTQLLRRGIQLAAFIFFPGLFLTAFNAIRDIASALITGTFTWAAMAEPVLVLAILLIVTIVWGRFFCGYLCAFGTIQDLMAILSRAFVPRMKKIPGKADRILKYMKYVVLSGIILFLWILQLPVDSSLSPWGIFGMLVSWNGSVMSAAIPTAGFGILLAILATSFFIERFFCRYLCPLGAIFTLTSGKRLFRIRRSEEQCTGCGACSRKCSMGIAVHEKETITSGECIDCMQCTAACYPKALSANPSPAVTGTATALIMGGLITVGNIASTRIQQSSETSVSAENDIAEEAVPKNNPASERNQNREQWNKKTTKQGRQNRRQQNSDANEQEDQTYNNRKDQEVPFDSDMIPDKNTDNTTEYTENSNAAESAENDSSSLQDGVYTGTGNGFRGATEVQVTVSDGKITDITILSYKDDSQFFNKAKNSVISAVLQAQSVNVSTVSGATYSSRGILEAVANAVGFEYTNTNSSGGKHR